MGPNADADANANADADADADADANADATVNVNDDTDMDVDANAKANVNTNANTNTDSDDNADVTANASTNADAKANTNTNTNANINDDADTDADTNADADADVDVDVDADAGADLSDSTETEGKGISKEDDEGKSVREGIEAGRGESQSINNDEDDNESCKSAVVGEDIGERKGDLEIKRENEQQHKSKQKDEIEIALERRELKILQDYVRNLHTIELTLRALLMRNGIGKLLMRRLTPEVIGAAADEFPDRPESMDWKNFLPQNDDDDDNSDSESGKEESEQEIDWIRSPSSSHPLLGSIICRPPLGESGTSVDMDDYNGDDDGDPGTDNVWYRIDGYVPSVLGPTEDTSIASTTVHSTVENAIVERRCRFLAVPLDKNDSDDIEEDDDSEGPSTDIVLTEGQVRAGVLAASMVLSQKKNVISNVRCHNNADNHSDNGPHPFRGMVGMAVLLTPLDNGGIKGKGKSKQTLEGISATLVGHDSVQLLNNDEVERRVLILPDAEDAEDGSEDKVEYVKAFWAKLLPSDASVAVRLSDGATFRLAPQEYHPSSLAYAACEAVLSFLRSDERMEPFMHPVDPVELEIPDYFSVIKHPMDFSTVEKNLSEGTYGRIPPGRGDASPVARMLRGSFRSHIILMFDNALTFNSGGDWVHSYATHLKKAASKKIEALASKAEREYERHPTNAGGKGKRSIYIDEDSDVDMYEYESDYDDEDTKNSGSRVKRGGRRKKRKRTSMSKEDDFAMRAIEVPLREHDVFGADVFSSLPIDTDCSRFGLPKEWSCRHAVKEDNEDNQQVKVDIKESEEKKQEQKEKDRLMLLSFQFELSNNSLRRSSRSNAKEIEEEDSSNLEESHTKIEYVLCDDSITDSTKESFVKIAENRSAVESIQELMHEELYANRFYKYYSDSNNPAQLLSQSANSEEDDNEIFEYGKFNDGTFPPYLGRIVPTKCPHSLSSKSYGEFAYDNVSWEIRTPFVIPALRWVIRGLINSGHLVELEPLSLGRTDGGGIIPTQEGMILVNHVYFQCNSIIPLDILDAKEMQRRKRSENASTVAQEEDEVELSEYEKLRAERVARNQERLKMLGL